MTRISDFFPPIGGITGALTAIAPHFGSILSTILLAAIGATVGYFVKLFWDWVIKRAK